MQPSGDSICSLIELSAGMELSKDDLSGRNPLGRVIFCRNAPAVIDNGDMSFSVDGYNNVSAVAGECFIDRVVNNFKDEVVESSLRGITDVHSRPLADRFETFEYLYLSCPIVLFEHVLPKGGR